MVSLKVCCLDVALDFMCAGKNMLEILLRLKINIKIRDGTQSLVVVVSGDDKELCGDIHSLEVREMSLVAALSKN